MLSIHLPQNPSSEQVASAIKLINIISGPDVIARAVAALNAELGLSAGSGVASSAVSAPPAPPAPLAPTPEAAFIPPQVPTPPSPPAGSGELDSKGLPWDERIHSSKKTKNQDGSWKGRKNVDDAAKVAVVAELRQRFPAPTETSAPPPPPPAAPPPPPPNGLGDIPANLDRRVPPPPAATPTGAMDFAGLMRAYTGYIGAGKKLNLDDLNNAVQQGTGGAANTSIELNQLPNKADYFPLVAEVLGNIAAGK